MKVSIVRTGVANVASVVAAFKRVGATPILVDTADEVHEAEFLMFPGVGAFGAGMSRLMVGGLVDLLRERIAVGRPTMAVCLGLQLLFESSDESPGVAGLGILPGHVARFPDHVRVPQFGWNLVRPDASCALLEEGYAYFANSYRVTTPPDGWSVAMADHGGLFVAGMERGAIIACQFHPELSGPWGMDLLKRWLEVSSC